MKIRIAEQHLRIRIRKSDLTLLMSGQAPVTNISWGAKQWQFTVELDQEPWPGIRPAEKGKFITLPAEVVQPWLRSNEVSLEFKVANNENPLTILLEKDLPCEHKSSDAPEELFSELAK